jgi:hypothetical protein
MALLALTVKRAARCAHAILLPMGTRRAIRVGVIGAAAVGSLVVAGNASFASSPEAGGMPPGVRAVVLQRIHNLERTWKDRHPYDIEAVLTTHRQADRIEDLSGTLTQGLPGNAPVYLVAMRGHFCEEATNVTEAQCTAAATCQVSARATKLNGTASLAEQYPDLRALGRPFRLRLGKH